VHRESPTRPCNWPSKEQVLAVVNDVSARGERTNSCKYIVYIYCLSLSLDGHVMNNGEDMQGATLSIF
jgi:hypothetical protein